MCRIKRKSRMQTSGKGKRNPKCCHPFINKQSYFCSATFKIFKNKSCFFLLFFSNKLIHSFHDISQPEKTVGDKMGFFREEKRIIIFQRYGHVVGGEGESLGLEKSIGCGLKKGRGMFWRLFILYGKNWDSCNIKFFWNKMRLRHKKPINSYKGQVSHDSSVPFAALWRNYTTKILKNILPSPSESNHLSPAICQNMSKKVPKF